MRPINRDYYYINFHATIDAIKFRIFHLTERVKALYKPSEEKKDFYCPRCKSQWTQIEALKNISGGEFLCDRCGFVLERDDTSAANTSGHERQSKLMAQLDGLLKLMRQIDSQEIPRNDFESAFALAVPIQRDEAVNPLRRTEPLDANASATGAGRPAAVHGVNAVAAPLEVSVLSSADIAGQRELEVQRKQEAQAQNALPQWHTRSTVTGEITAVGTKELQRFGVTGLGPVTMPKTEEEEKKAEDDGLGEQLAEYYAQMAKERAEAEKQDQESEGDDDEDDMAFEDVIGVADAGMPQGRSSNVNGVVKAESNSSSSAAVTRVPTPATDVGDDGGAAKRRKVEEVQVEVEAEDSDEDDVEFEDVS